MEQEIFIDGISYKVPAPVFRFVNDCLAYLEGNPGPSRADVFGYDDGGQPYRTLPASDDARLDQLENLLSEFSNRFESLLTTISGGNSGRSARGRSKSFTVVDRVGTRPIYKEILDRISTQPTREEIVRLLMETDYSESSARNIAPTYLRYVLENIPGPDGAPRKKVKFSQMTEIGREGNIKIYQEILDAISESGGQELTRPEIIKILTDFGFSESSAQVRARYYTARLETA